MPRLSSSLRTYHWYGVKDRTREKRGKQEAVNEAHGSVNDEPIFIMLPVYICLREWAHVRHKLQCDKPVLKCLEVQFERLEKRPIVEPRFV